ncbi:MAG TPA: branched-chain amino acid ABC transporter permease [Methylomirabilota bacterium]|nr:branched-chain amino acid ABC transporter permease [Methylomirabilota bacterium]
MIEAGPASAVSAGIRPRALPRGAAGWALAATILAVLPVVPGLDTNFVRSLLSQMGIAAIFACSYNVLLGETGLLSFGHAVYFGLGGYVAIHAMRWINAGLPVPIALVPLFGALGGLVFGLLIGAVTTRRAGTVFAMISLGLGELVVAASLTLTRFFGGEEGITANRTRAPHPLGLRFATQLEVYYLIAAWALGCIALMYLFTRTPVGRMCNAVRDNPERAEFVGYDPRRVRLVAFVVAAGFAGAAGGLHAINYEIVAAESLGAARSGAVLLMAYIGGIDHFFGPVLGAVVLTWLQVNLSDYTSAWQLYFGLFFILVVLFAPGGLAGLLARHAPLVRAGTLHRLAPAYLAATGPLLVAALGAVSLIEISYRLATKPELGTRMRLFGVAMDVSRPWPWLGAALLLAAGIGMLLRLAPLVRRAWDGATAAGAAGRPGARP